MAEPPALGAQPSFDGLHEPDALLEALLLFQSGEYAAAVTLCAELEAAYPPHWCARSIRIIATYEMTFQGVEMATELRPVIPHLGDWSEPRLRLAAVLEGIGQVSESASHYEAVLQSDSLRIEALVGLANCQLGLGHRAGAERSLQRALGIPPRDAVERYQLMHAYGLLGHWREAWASNELRLGLVGYNREHRLHSPLPKWDGRLVDRLVVADEQGAGDVIQFIRFLPLVSDRARHVSCRIQHQSLIDLFRHNYPNVEFFGVADVMPEADAMLPLLSSVARLGITETAVPFRDGYLKAPDPCRKSHVPRIGLCWRGRPTHRRDGQRSIHPALWEPITQLEGFEFVNLTVGRGPTIERVGLRQPALPDYATTANVIAGCHLVISCDTSVLHLAAALGVQTWGLISAAPDFRWMLGRVESPWYRPLTLYRAERSNEWSDVIAGVTNALRSLRRTSLT